MRTFLRYLPARIRDKLILSQLRVEDEELRGLTFKIATTVDEHEQASRLTHDAYVKRGIIEPQRAAVWVTAHGLLPWTVVFVAKRGEQVIGTMSLVVDSAVGLPMDKIYRDEVVGLRSAGRHLAEVGALSVGGTHRRRGVALLLNKLMWRCAFELLHVDTLVISVHPDAACVYEATLRFQKLGTETRYPGLTDKGRAVALRLDLDTAEAVLARDFGSLGADLRSPYYLYCVRQDPQLVMPTVEDFGAARDALRVVCAEKLGAMRPECFNDLDTPQRRVLRPILPGLSDYLRSVTLQSVND